MRIISIVLACFLGLVGGANSGPSTGPPLPPAGPQWVLSTDPSITTGIQGTIQYQFIPGVPGATWPDPKPWKGVIVRILGKKGDHVIAETTTNNAGQFRIALQKGDYRIEFIPPRESYLRHTPIPVLVKEGLLSIQDATLSELGV